MMRSEMGGILSILRLSNGKLLDGNKEITFRKDGWVMLAVDTSGSMANTLEEAKKHAVTFYTIREGDGAIRLDFATVSTNLLFSLPG